MMHVSSVVELIITDWVFSCIFVFLSELSGPALLLRLNGCLVKYCYFNIIPNIMTDVLLLLLL